MNKRTPEETAQEFVGFAQDYKTSSPLYHTLSLRIAGDTALLELASHTRPGQPPANMLFGAVHDVLLRDVAHPLARYYRSVGGSTEPGPEAFEAFRELCLSQRDELRHLLATRLTQTNETRRCAYLLPAFASAAALGGGRPLALIEIGPSAGLNMGWDRYGYDYGDGRIIGDAASPVRITTELRGAMRPPIPPTLPAVAWRIGVDLSPVNLEDSAARRWLEALIWPEHGARVERLRAAITLARTQPPPIVAGDALELLPKLIAAAPADASLCVYHTHVTYQFSRAQRGELDGLLVEAGQHRPLLRLSCEGFGNGFPQLRLTRYSQGATEEQLLAVASGHGNWLDWRGA